MRQVVVIKGGNEFPTHEKYIEYLERYVIRGLEYFTEKKIDWQSTLQEQLGSKFFVIRPEMPSRKNAKYAEWELWFQKIANLLSDDVILIGHSLGATFLAKYLSERQFPKKIRATFLVAGPHGKEIARPIVGFRPSHSLGQLERQSGTIFLYHSEDDPVVPFEELDEYRKALPRAHVHTFTDRGHFGQKSFPELMKDIRGC